MAGPGPVTCDECQAIPDPGELAEPGEPPWTWSVDNSGGERSWLCPRCARKHARSIEARLEPDWW